MNGPPAHMIAFQASHSSRSASRILACAALRISTDSSEVAFVQTVGVSDAFCLRLTVAARQRNVDVARGHGPSSL